ncbi:transcription factor EMB1444-like isoform X1 [Olea europaea subsp. europaea]|uniref:Transcription factor EMB1444-like isoform X1 n=1 Tax=Olea europaea subsp. europaea TaxID=158383 RepID=A0A8S0PDF0_OLEEU|nr:transcription factor EMB1444-like isoform X1 [Olea europaea subsp. europaea]
MGSHLGQVLRSLCFNTSWKYAVFWKLKHRSRMMLTCEDAYYDNNQYPERKSFNEIVSSDHNGPFTRTSWISCGQNVISNVLSRGRHCWAGGNSPSTSECFDGWQDQFSSGIKTIAVVAVIPHGVIQLGSLNKIPEDPKLDSDIRHVFSMLHDPLAGFIPLSRQSSVDNSCLIFPCPGKPRHHSYFFPPPEGFFNRDQKQVELKSFTKTKCDGVTTDMRDPTNISSLFVKDTNSAGCNLYNATLPTNKSGTDMPYIPSKSLDPAACKDQAGVFGVPELFNMLLSQDLGKNLESITKSNQLNSHGTPTSFSAGYELYEALGPSFRKQKTYCDGEAEKTGSEMAVEISEGMGSSNLLIANYDSEDLLDAVVGKISHDGDDIYSEKSLLTAEKTLKTFKSDVVTISSAGYSFDLESVNSLNSSATYGVQAFKGISSTSSSRGSEYSKRTLEQVNVKITIKRARPCKSCRPRPRDRKLIQDRIKELRELVPNGSKCSIDSLLEQTIKHMLCMQSMPTHADKLNRWSASKLLDKDMGIGSSCNDQGLSWAMEVGNNPKAFPIVVENINMNGQMLVKMICEEHSHFLDIAETIRSLGLIILKGVTEAYENKMWMCFEVKGQKSRSMHRMDVLWSLMHLLQPRKAN